ncbi:toxin [Streptomyces sp. NPDC048603]|uniref:toxin n=1 Tax=Streptomyces sp. NPDC048603 TaxID=3365577 RepID=UPI003723BFD1
MKLPGSATPASEDRLLRRRLKKVRRACEELLAEWGMEHGCGIDELHRYLSEERGRPIHLVPTSFPERHLFGIWLKLDDFDVVAFEKSASPSHKEHIIAHELSHIAFEHRGSVQPDGGDPGRGLTDVDPAAVRGILMRSRYSDDEEQEAETMASLILARATKRWVEPVWALPDEAADIVARIEHGIGGNSSGGNGSSSNGNGSGNGNGKADHT